MVSKVRSVPGLHSRQRSGETQAFLRAVDYLPLPLPPEAAFTKGCSVPGPSPNASRQPNPPLTDRECCHYPLTGKEEAQECDPKITALHWQG